MGSGFNSIANSLSLTTYFKKKRRIAYGISRTIVGIGPIIMPHIVTATLPLYGVEGCLWLYVVLAIFAALCAIFFQPSQRRAKKTEESSTSTKARNEPNCTNEPLSGQDMRYLSSRSLSVLPDINRGLSKVTLEGRPVAEANDFPSCRSSINPTPTECHGSYVGTSTAEKEWQGEVSPKLEELVANGSRIATVMSFHEYHACENGRCISANPEVILPTIGIAGEKIQPPHLWRKIVLFFDLDLLCDMSYVNLLVGITVANFAEMNFATLTPFILADWNYTKLEIASIMSMVGGVDLAARFFIPFIAGRIGWENKTFFLVGILILAMSRLCELLNRLQSNHLRDHHSLSIYYVRRYHILPIVLVHSGRFLLRWTRKWIAYCIHRPGHTELCAVASIACRLRLATTLRRHFLRSHGTGRW